MKEVKLLEEFCLKNNLVTYDPYDIWKTNLGLSVKDFYNKNRYLALIPASILVFYDQFINNRLRFGYKTQEYPIVRGLAAQILLNLYKSTGNDNYLVYAKDHLDWLANNSCEGYSGNSWGIGFTWPVSKKIVYDLNTPLATHTPYVLEAFDKFTKITGDDSYVDNIRSCYEFYENDIQIMFETTNSMATSYGPFKDRIVTNSVSYTLFAYSIFLDYIPSKKKYIQKKISKLYNFLKDVQLTNGSWYYAAFDNNSFIDCFHSCIVLKNIIKSQNRAKIFGHDYESVVSNGYNYITTAFYDNKRKLYKRFSKNNKINIIKFDLYDNAEFLTISRLLGDINRYESLKEGISNLFVKNNNIYSSQNFLGFLINKNTLRWGVMPYLYSLSITDDY